MYLINEALQKNKRVVFIADRKTLINQTSAVADSLGLVNHSVFMANHWRYNPSLPFQIASAQTIARRGWPEADLYIIDEAHTMMKAWTNHVNDCKGAVIGLSATPFSTGLGKYFTNLINATTMHDLTESGVLVPMRIFSCTQVDMRGAETIGGEWTDAAAGERGMSIVGDVVQNWKKFAENEKTIVFGATIAHCEKMCQEFNENGIMANVFTAETSEKDRKIILDEYEKENTELRVLVSVEALAKGFDQKDIGCICDVRPLRKSLSTVMQMLGRGFRSSPKTNKKNFILLDFSGNIIRFAEDFEDIYFNGLDQLNCGEKLDKKIRKDDEEKVREKTGCPKCHYKPFFKRCISCGFKIEKKDLIEHEQGEMLEFKLGKASFGEKLSIWKQCVTLCGLEGNPTTAKNRASYLYKSMTGVFPQKMPDFYTIQPVLISDKVRNKHTANMIAYRYSLKR